MKPTLQKYRKVLTKEYGGNVKNVGIDGCQLYTIDAVMDRIVLVVVDGRVERNKCLLHIVISLN